MAKAVELYGQQALQFAAIGATDIGRWSRTKLLISMAKHWDELHSLPTHDADSGLLIGELPACETFDDIPIVVEAFMNAVVQDGRVLELRGNVNNMLRVERYDGPKGDYTYTVTHHLSFGDKFIHQGTTWRFQETFELLDALYHAMNVSNWEHWSARLPSENIY